MSKHSASSEVQTVPYISIVIPTRNRPELLFCALSRVKAQTFKNYEVIVIDDGSEEPVRSVYAQRWGELDDRFKLKIVGAPGQHGLGPSAARNQGILASVGDIVTFCDDDDYWIAEDHLHNMAAVFSSRADIDMYISNQKGVSGNDIRIRDWLPKLTKTLRDTGTPENQGRVVTVRELCASGSFAHLNILSLRKNVASRINGFWEKVGYEEDRDFFWRAVDQSNKIFYNPAIAAQHNIPDRDKKINQSTQHSMVERWLLSVLVSQHISTTVKNKAIVDLACSYEGDILRHLSQHFISTGSRVSALQSARRALAARFSFKWFGFLAYLTCKSMLLRDKT